MAPYDVMTAQQERSLAITLGELQRAYSKRPSTANAAAWRAARDRFVRANLRLVAKIAHQYHAKTRVALLDLIQEGNIGLMIAVDRFDPEKKVRFATYAAWWIRHCIQRSLQRLSRTVRIPLHVTQSYYQLERIREQLESTLGCQPTVEQLAQAAKLPVDKVHRVAQAMSMGVASLDAPISETDPRPLAELLTDDRRSVHEMLEDADTRQLLNEALTYLEPLEIDIIRHRFGLDGASCTTLRKLGERYGLSRERVRQLQLQAIRKVRRFMRLRETRAA